MSVKILILQSTPQCNMNCSYCYLSEESRMPRSTNDGMSIATLKKISKVIDDSAIENLTINFHAGEPLMMPIDYYKQAIDILGHRHKYVIQTNATLINQEWINFFIDYNIGVGVSIDGPKEIHDAYRQSWNQKSTHALTERGMKLMLKNNFNFGCITVLTKEVLKNPKKVFTYLAQYTSNIAFNIFETVGNVKNNVDNEYNQLYKSFYTELYEIYKKIKKNNLDIRFREFDTLEQYISNENQHEIFRNQENKPLELVTIDLNGNINLFTPESAGSEFMIDNVKNINTFNDLLFNTKFIELYKKIFTGVKNCMNECSLYSICGGGAPGNKLSENNSLTSTRTEYCNLAIKTLSDIYVKNYE